MGCREEWWAVVAQSLFCWVSTADVNPSDDSNRSGHSCLCFFIVFLPCPEPHWGSQWTRRAPRSTTGSCKQFAFPLTTTMSMCDKPQDVFCLNCGSNPSGCALSVCWTAIRKKDFKKCFLNIQIDHSSPFCQLFGTSVDSCVAGVHGFELFPF